MPIELSHFDASRRELVPEYSFQFGMGGRRTPTVTTLQRRRAGLNVPYQGVTRLLAQLVGIDPCGRTRPAPPTLYFETWAQAERITGLRLSGSPLYPRSPYVLTGLQQPPPRRRPVVVEIAGAARIASALRGRPGCPEPSNFSWPSTTSIVAS